ncbi:MAG: hypothetical protein ACOC6L_04770 [Thermodesulfobacteriota bacterium]
MKILHLYRHPPDDLTRELAARVSQDREPCDFFLFQEPVDYDRLLTLILEHDQVISWW